MYLRPAGRQDIEQDGAGQQGSIHTCADMSAQKIPRVCQYRATERLRLVPVDPGFLHWNRFPSHTGPLAKSPMKRRLGLGPFTHGSRIKAWGTINRRLPARDEEHQLKGARLGLRGGSALEMFELSTLERHGRARELSGLAAGLELGCRHGRVGRATEVEG
jgi:hypothetical protein